MLIKNITKISPIKCLFYQTGDSTFVKDLDQENNCTIILNESQIKNKEREWGHLLRPWAWGQIYEY